ncbi:MAG: bifunctional DNA-formamidopyrimidine glycosylase/DNA-(apurinic or apyrimidinic site) lyase [Ilumatobacteraceae bacterium]|nr:bifunctional DNA-formamidopyrimidine glycosylase/DNA-(apurinic or apyrimidinic site) lyase [Ilumatobacteraceae bacterium]
MPELPEVETVRRGIESLVVGRTISSVFVGRERSVRRVGREAVIQGLTGTSLVSARRRGKYLICDLSSGDRMMVHLRMSGRVLIHTPEQPQPPHTHVVLTLEPDRRGARRNSAHEFRFVDPRTFGEVVVYDPMHEGDVLPELARLGVDPLVDQFDDAVVWSLLHPRKRAIKALLLDQHVIAGIGNIYADEILHRAGIKWNRLASSLSWERVIRLRQSISDVLSEAVAAGGSTLQDTQYVDVEGETGWFQLDHRVYGRGGLPCLTCGKTSITRVVTNGRSTCFCRICQR